MRALLKIGHRCNNACVFCHAADRRGDDTLARILDKVDRARDLGVDTVVLSGGEPTLHPGLEAIARHIQARGMKLGLVTNGRVLCLPAVLGPLLDAGLDYAYVSLHAPTAEIHDRLVGVSGAFDETLRGLRALHGRVAHLWVNTVVTRANLAVVPDLIDVASELPESVMKLTFPQPKGAVLAAFDAVVPGLAEASQAVIRAFEHARRRGHQRLGHEGFPLCLLPGFEALRDDLRTHGFLGMSELHDRGFEPIDDALRVWPEPCDGCSLRDGCPGVYRELAARRGWRELRPRRTAPRLIVDPADEIETREQASHEQRCWVRLAWGCNNACLFCLDKEHGRSGLRAPEEILAEIVDGRRRGATRLVLSGGEPTMHPRFLDLVRMGRRAGYRWIQTVSNGRMFCTPGFLERAIDSGLSELTVSLHGHTSALHDELVGVPGAFEQSSTAVRAALASRRIVVNVDVVINGRNVDHLPEMIETFAGWGVNEFDLLHVIPFGNAWRLRDRGLFYDPKDKADAIRAALEAAKRHGARVWLNRFPPEHAEGFESLIQDPHKLIDEVRGRDGELRAWIERGQPLACRQPERCRRCYLRGLCDALEAAIDAMRSGRVPRLIVSSRAASASPTIACEELEIACDEATICADAARRFGARALRVRTRSTSWLEAAIDSDGTLAGRPVRAVCGIGIAELERALRLPDPIGVEVNAVREDWPAILAAACPRLVVRQPAHARLTEARALDVEPSALHEVVERGARTRGIASCLGGQHPVPEPFALDLDLMDAEGRIDPYAFASWWACEGFMTRSLRCRTCADDAACRGMPVNWVRAHGFGPLRPRSR